VDECEPLPVSHRESLPQLPRLRAVRSASQRSRPRRRRARRTRRTHGTATAATTAVIAAPDRHAAAAHPAANDTRALSQGLTLVQCSAQHKHF